jgi:hypothetical protein
MIAESTVVNDSVSVSAVSDGAPDGAVVIDGFAAHQMKKRLAHMAVQRAVWNGYLVRKPCEECGAIRNDDGSVIQTHHDDYDRALEVRWLCKNHHQQWHRENGRAYFDAETGQDCKVLLANVPHTAFQSSILTGKLIRAARGLMGWTQRELARVANVGLGTVRRMEDAAGPVSARIENVISVAVAFEAAGVEFLNDDRPGVRMKSASK